MSNAKRSRRHLMTEQNVAVLQRRLVDKVPVSTLCEENELQRSVFDQWLRHALGSIGAALGPPVWEAPSKRETALAAKSKEVEAKLARKDNVIAEVTTELVKTKKSFGSSDRTLGSPRYARHDEEFVRARSDKTEISVDDFIAWIGIARGKFFSWRKRYGKANEHNALILRDHWLLDEE